MTEIIQYENLTWPEVAALPRDLPLVIPLGSGFDLGLLTKDLAQPPRLGLLPAIPYGWAGSLLDVPHALLAAYASNLLHSLRQDGFTDVHLLASARLDLGLGESMIVQSLASASAHLSEAEASKVVIIPIGHTEQHGLHLPLNTDTLIIDAIAQGTAAGAASEALALPVMPYGVSTHRSSFAGTLNAGGRAFEDFHIAVVDALIARGFDRLYFISGHGGNCSYLTTVVKAAGERHPRAFVATSWLYLSGPAGIAALEQHRRSPIGGMGHACELETALLLHLRPGLVHMDRLVPETDFVTTPSYYMDWIEGGALIANPPWDDDTRTGAYGDGSVATAEHGRLWLAAAILEKIGHVREIHEQQRRREERRNAGFGLWGGRK
jgi:creatinine amidohydrolase